MCDKKKITRIMQNVRLCLNHNRKVNNCGSYGQTLEKNTHAVSQYEQ